MEYNVFANTLDMDKAEWRKLRKNGIGGSDVGSICGVNPYRSALDVYLEKLSPYIDDDEPNERMYWGTVHEETIAREFTIRTGKKVRRKNAILRHHAYPWMIANIDREVLGERAILECKTADKWAAKQWDNNQVPESYVLQVQHYMAVLGYDRAYICCLIGGNQFEIRTIERNENLINYIIDIEKEFWERVEKKIPPPVDGSRACTELMSKLYPVGEPSIIQLESDVEYWITKRTEALEKVDEYQEKAEEAENNIKQLLGNNEVGQTLNYVVSWKNGKPKDKFDTKKFKEDFPEIASKYYKPGSPYRLFKIQPKEEKKNE